MAGAPRKRKIWKKQGCVFCLEYWLKQERSFSLTLKIHLKPFKRMWSELVELRKCESELRKWIWWWLGEQEEYEDRICIVDMGQDSSYAGKQSNVSVDIAVKQKRTTKFSDTVNIFESKIDSFYGSLTSLLRSNGYELR